MAKSAPRFGRVSAALRDVLGRRGLQAAARKIAETGPGQAFSQWIDRRFPALTPSDAARLATTAERVVQAGVDMMSRDRPTVRGTPQSQFAFDAATDPRQAQRYQYGVTVDFLDAEGTPDSRRMVLYSDEPLSTSELIEEAAALAENIIQRAEKKSGTPGFGDASTPGQIAAGGITVDYVIRSF